MKVKELKAELEMLGLSTVGKKAVLETNQGSVDLFPCPASYKGSNCNECRECSKHHRENIVVFKET